MGFLRDATTFTIFAGQTALYGTLCYQYGWNGAAFGWTLYTMPFLLYQTAQYRAGPKTGVAAKSLLRTWTDVLIFGSFISLTPAALRLLVIGAIKVLGL